MANLNEHNARIQVLITEETELGKFSDALYFTPEEFEALSDDDVKKEKKGRADKWVKSVKDASKREYTPTVEDLEAEKAELTARIAELDAKVAEVEVVVTKK